MEKIYLVVAHCADGDVIINRNGMQFYSTYDDAKTASDDFIGIHPTEIIEYKRV